MPRRHRREGNLFLFFFFSSFLPLEKGLLLFSIFCFACSTPFNLLQSRLLRTRKRNRKLSDRKASLFLFLSVSLSLYAAPLTAAALASYLGHQTFCFLSLFLRFLFWREDKEFLETRHEEQFLLRSEREEKIEREKVKEDLCRAFISEA